MSKISREPIHLIIYSYSDNKAEQLVNIFRNAGYAVRPNFVNTLDDLEEHIEKVDADIMLADSNTPDFNAPATIRLINQYSRDIPVILLTENFNAETVTEFLQQGITDVVLDDKQDHIKVVVQRELANIRMRREYKNSLAKQKELDKRCESLLASSRDAIAYLVDGIHVHANQSYLHLFGYEDADDLLAIPVLDVVASDSQAEFKDYLKKYKNEQTEEEFHFRAVKDDGAEFDASMKMTPAEYDGEECTQVVIQIGSQDPELAKKLAQLSTQDLLTGLFNRTYFLDEAEKAVGQAQKNKILSVVMYMELDNFDKLQESLGIANSDLFLTDIAKWIQEYVGDNEYHLSRFAEDTFTLLLSNTKMDDAKAFAEGIREKLADALFDNHGNTVTTTASIGLSLIGESSSSGQQAVDQAHEVAVSVKRKGGNKVHAFDPNALVSRSAAADNEVIEALQEAWEQGRLHTFYQPIVNLHGTPALYYEVLIRMTNAAGDEVAAEEFYPSAKEVGLAGKLDRWVLIQVAKALAKERQQGRNIVLFVMLSPDTIIDETFGPWYRTLLKEARLPADAIVLEFTEHDAVNHLKRAKNVSATLHELHGKCALTHFGTTQNSENVFKHIEPDYIKIDGQLSAGLMSSTENQEKLQALSEIVHEAQKTSIMPLVEDASTVAMLYQYGIHYIQGFYLAPAGPRLDYEFGTDH